MCSLVGLFFVRCDAFAVHRCFECWMFRYRFASDCVCASASIVVLDSQMAYMHMFRICFRQIMFVSLWP